MKLHLTTAENNYLITGYGTGFVEINKQRFNANLIVMPNKLVLDWPATNFASLIEAHFMQIVELNPELVLLGTGEKHQFLHPKITQKLTQNGIVLECMTTNAACRTYNILMSEGRHVAAALLL
ncbi:MAG: Mth938-like domain-containing protein [Bdellovibrio sp.]|nr:Mth938-like domain-containing protein [Methylotenera sp.]